MEIRINGVASEVPGPWSSVPELVHAFYACGRFPGEMITAIQVGGSVAALDDAARIDPVPAAPIEVSTMPGREVFAQTVRAIRVELADLAESLRSGAGTYRRATEAQAHTAFLECVERLDQVVQVVRDLSDLSGVVDLGISAATALPDEAMLEAVVEEMIASQERADWIMLADLMEYELAPALDRWRDQLGADAVSTADANLPA